MQHTRRHGSPHFGRVPRSGSWPTTSARALAAIAFSALVFAVLSTSAEALGGGSGSVSLSSLGTAYTQDFDSLANTGTTNVLSLNGWYLNETGISANNNGQYAASSGTNLTGDVYSFG